MPPALAVYWKHSYIAGGNSAVCHYTSSSPFWYRSYTQPINPTFLCMSRASCFSSKNRIPQLVSHHPLTFLLIERQKLMVSPSSKMAQWKLLSLCEKADVLTGERKHRRQPGIHLFPIWVSLLDTFWGKQTAAVWQINNFLVTGQWRKRCVIWTYS